MSQKLEDRKQVLPQFRELFLALFKIKDTEIQNRILDAINSVNQVAPGKVLEDKSTQTCIADFEMVQDSNFYIPKVSIQNEVDNTRKRKKRKLRGPRVEKSITEVKKVLIQNDRSITVKSEVKEENNNIKMNAASDSELGDIEELITLGDSYMADMFLPIPPNLENLTNIMKDEYNSCQTYSKEGLYPIHDAILTNNLYKLKRQLYVFQFLEINLIDVLEENKTENLLQFAIVNGCKAKIFDEIIKNENLKKYLFGKDLEENNLIHLAVDCLEENLNVDLFNTLLKAFFFNLSTLKYLQDTNSSGETVLHMCVIADKPIFCHLLFQQIDNLLKIKSGTITAADNNNLSKELLLDYYTAKMGSNCTNFLQYDLDTKLRKNQIVNCTNLKHGLTPLSQAIQNNNELLIRIFLYNLADANIKNRSGLSSLELCEVNSKIYNIILEYTRCQS